MHKMNDDLPDVYYGTVGNTAEPIDDDREDVDDVELEETPKDVVEVLGFDPLDLDNAAMDTKYIKSSVDFEHPAKGSDHCQFCRHFLTTENECELVAGLVHSEDWCKLFEKR